MSFYLLLSGVFDLLSASGMFHVLLSGSMMFHDVPCCSMVFYELLLGFVMFYEVYGRCGEVLGGGVRSLGVLERG